MDHEEAKNALLKIQHLKTHFFTDEGIVRAVDDVSLTLRQGETLGLVGESGCGKSVTALSVIRLVPEPSGRIVSGSILLVGQGDLTRFTEPEMRKIRGNEISMIFQEPMTSLNPVYRIGEQIAEAIKLHLKVSRGEAMDRSVEMLQQVGIPSAGKRIRDYPYQLSGGMRQRVMIAMAMSCNPRLMLADEPTTALDVTIQAQILDLMNRLKESAGTSIILITHDLCVIAEMAHSVAVMYAGVIVESADVRTLFGEPMHPYTKGLLDSIPRIDRGARKRTQLYTIPGIVPSLLNLPTGCRFSDRCSHVREHCRMWEPNLSRIQTSSNPDHLVRCWLYLTPPG
jgi:peptide/nickel transport system ATP-binding protein/oligopeptide transport system ATP-binding protein